MRVQYEPVGEGGHAGTFDWAAGDDWAVSGDVERGPFGLVVSRLEIRRPGESSGVTSGMLREIPVGEILAAVRIQLAQEEARQGASQRGRPDGVVAEAVGAPRRSGRAPLTPDLLRRVAIAYLQENTPGAGPGAMARLARRFGKPEETMRQWVARSRRDGWLGPGTKGRAGAEPGPKLIASGTALEAYS